MSKEYSDIISEVYSKLRDRSIVELIYYYYLKELRPIINIDS